MWLSFLTLFMFPISHPLYHHAHPFRLPLSLPSVPLFAPRLSHRIIDSHTHLTLILSHPLLRNHPHLHINVLSQPPLLHLHISHHAPNCSALRLSHSIFLPEPLANASVHVHQPDSHTVTLTLEKLSTRIRRRVSACLASRAPHRCLNNLARSTCAPAAVRSVLRHFPCGYSCAVHHLTHCIAARGLFSWLIAITSTLMFVLVTILIVVSFLWGFSYAVCALPPQLLCVLHVARHFVTHSALWTKRPSAALPP